MRRVLIALIIHRNRYLISKITEGTLSGQWEFPGGLVHPGESDFDAIKQAIKQRLGIDISHYITLKQLVYRSQDDTIELTLIKCSITDASKRILSSNGQFKYDWLHLPFVAHIDFTARDKKIVRHLTSGLFLVQFCPFGVSTPCLAPVLFKVLQSGVISSIISHHSQVRITIT